MLSIFLITTVLVARMNCFNYADEGPDMWPAIVPSCNGRKQSPININDWEAEYNPLLTPFNCFNFELELNWNSTHDGSTVVFLPLDSEMNRLIFMTDSMKGIFYVLELRFRWGENNYQGSEHYIDGNKFPLEVQLMFKSSSNDFAVLGFFFKISRNNNTLLDPLIQSVDRTYNASTSIRFKLKMGDIIPEKVRLGNYYRYMGSRTTPPCTENIIWTIFETPIEISAAQLEIFHKNSISKNFRHPQRLFKRAIHSNRKERRQNIEDAGMNASHHNCNIIEITILMIVNVILCNTLYLY